MTIRFAPETFKNSRSKLLGLMIGCGVMIGALPAKSQSLTEPTPDKFKTTLSFSDSTIIPTTNTGTEETNAITSSKAKNARQNHPRWSAYIPMACHHSERELWHVPVQYNEKNNQGLIVGYEVLQGKSSSVYVTAGAYKNSLYQLSETASVGFRQYLDKHNQFTLSIEAGAAMYKKLHKNFVDNGQKIMPTGIGPSKPIPMAMLYLQDNIVQAPKFDLGIKLGFTVNPKDKTNLATAGIVFTPHFGGNNRQNSSYVPTY